MVTSSWCWNLTIIFSIIKGCKSPNLDKKRPFSVCNTAYFKIYNDYIQCYDEKERMKAKEEIQRVLVVHGKEPSLSLLFARVFSTIKRVADIRAEWTKEKVWFVFVCIMFAADSELYKVYVLVDIIKIEMKKVMDLKDNGVFFMLNTKKITDKSRAIFHLKHATKLNKTSNGTKCWICIWRGTRINL